MADTRLEERLRILVFNGADCIPMAQDIIAKNKLPLQIVETDGKFELRSTYTPGELHLNKFITVDSTMTEMKREAMLMSHTPHEVLVYGETGTGKDLISCSQINDRKGSIKVVNCSGLPKELIEAELFGYVVGAFTGANKNKEGLMSSAEDGLMFLDEIGDLDLAVQAKLLRAVQYKVIRKVGSNVEEKINCKFVCATHRNLESMVKTGTFREDLYARLSTLELSITPLRERMCDVKPICESMEGGKEFWNKYGQQLMDGMFDLSLNVRSLYQYITRYTVLGKVKSNRMT